MPQYEQQPDAGTSRRRKVAEAGGIEFDTQTGKPKMPSAEAGPGVLTPQQSREISSGAVAEANLREDLTQRAARAAEEAGQAAMAGSQREPIASDHRLTA